MKKQSSDVLVSICCTAYNLERFIGEAIDSFLMQQTKFRYEIIIGEDCSCDSTREIIMDYQRRFPDLIHVVISGENVGIIRNYSRILEKAKGKYIAICDGDDYWTDPLKLQKQVNLLEASQEYTICCHYSYLVNESGQIIYAAQDLKPLIYTYHNVLTEKRAETRNSTLMIRNTEEFKKLTTEKWFLKCYAQDRFFKLFATMISGKNIYVIPEIMGAYRIHKAGIRSLASTKIVGFKTRSDFDVIIKNFRYPDEQKRKLRDIYFKRYFFYDLKQCSFIRVASTIKALA